MLSTSFQYGVFKRWNKTKLNHHRHEILMRTLGTRENFEDYKIPATKPNQPYFTPYTQLPLLVLRFADSTRLDTETAWKYTRRGPHWNNKIIIIRMIITKIKMCTKWRLLLLSLSTIFKRLCLKCLCLWVEVKKTGHDFLKHRPFNARKTRANGRPIYLLLIYRSAQFLFAFYFSTVLVPVLKAAPKWNWEPKEIFVAGARLPVKNIQQKKKLTIIIICVYFRVFGASHHQLWSRTLTAQESEAKRLDASIVRLQPFLPYKLSFMHLKMVNYGFSLNMGRSVERWDTQKKWWMKI